MSKCIGFVSTRFAGTDGVSMEASKWAQVLEQAGHHCVWMAGELDREPAACHLVAEAHFKHPRVEWINGQVFGHKHRSGQVTDAIHEVKTGLKHEIRRFIDRFGVDLFVAENALTIPMNIPLGVALTEIIAEQHLPTIAHHHDFFWERTRYALNAVGDYLHMAFPPKLHNIEHVVINSAAQEELALRTGISSTIIPNVIDFDTPPEFDLAAGEAFRAHMGLTGEDKIILQPTRVVQRKGIEHAIDLVHQLGDPRCKLVISHEAGDEGHEYRQWLQDQAKSLGVDLRLVNIRVTDPFNGRSRAIGQMTLWDIYPHADFITYPSLYEGFGNAFLEAVYFRKPLLINRYAIFVRDIEPCGFNLVVMDGFLSERNVTDVRHILASADRRNAMTTHNFDVARQYFSYAALRRVLGVLIGNFFGFPDNSD